VAHPPCGPAWPGWNDLKEADVTTDRRRRALRLPPAAESDAYTLDDDAVSGSDADPRSLAMGRLDTATPEGWTRMCWPMHLYAVLGNEVGRAVEAGILTVGEGEFLVARLTVVIDQAIGVDDKR
jgi:hypothetical protein